MSDRSSKFSIGSLFTLAAAWSSCDDIMPADPTGRSVEGEDRIEVAAARRTTAANAEITSCNAVRAGRAGNVSLVFASMVDIVLSLKRARWAARSLFWF
jgi:hypothetical protein